MKNNLIVAALLGIVNVCLFCSSLAAQVQNPVVVKSADMLEEDVYDGSSIPDAIVSGNGDKLSLLRSSDTLSDIIKWADQHSGLLYIQEFANESVVAVNVDSEKRAWVLLYYTGPKPWELAAVVKAELPACATLSSAEYDWGSDSLVVYANTGKLVARVSLGRRSPDSIIPYRPPRSGIQLDAAKCIYQYPSIPSSIHSGPVNEIKHPLLSAGSRDEIVGWAQGNGYYCVTSVGLDHLVVSTNVGSGAMIFEQLVYVRTSTDKPWTLACVGAVHTDDYETAGMYIDEKSREFVLANAYGDKIGVMAIGDFAVSGKL